MKEKHYNKITKSQFFFFQNLLLESPAHFEEKISQLICISRYRDENVQILEKKFSKKFEYFDSIPMDLESKALPHSVILIDDYEQELTSDRDVIKMILRFGSHVTHHLPCSLFVICQGYSIFYASSKIHQALYQATMLILFKSHSSMNILKRVLNGFNVKIKSGDTLFQVFKDYCSGSHRYIVINLHPSLDSALVYSNILYNCKESFIMFT